MGGHLCVPGCPFLFFLYVVYENRTFFLHLHPEADIFEKISFQPLTISSPASCCGQANPSSPGKHHHSGTQCLQTHHELGGFWGQGNVERPGHTSLHDDRYRTRFWRILRLRAQGHSAQHLMGVRRKTQIPREWHRRAGTLRNPLMMALLTGKCPGLSPHGEPLGRGCWRLLRLCLVLPWPLVHDRCLVGFVSSLSGRSACALCLTRFPKLLQHLPLPLWTLVHSCCSIQPGSVEA